MKKIILILLLCCSISVLAENVTSGYFVVPNPIMAKSVQEQLGNKIKVALSKAGINATDGYFPMVTMVKYDELETIVIEGMRKMYKTSGIVNILITFTNTNASLAAESFNVEGIGISEKIAQSNAIQNINIPPKTLTDMMASAKKGYEQALVDYANGRVTEAKKLKASKDYYGAIEIASEVPASSKIYKDAQKLITDCESALDKEAKEAQKKQDEESKRNFELQKEKIKADKELAKEREKTKQDDIKANADVQQARSKANERYYRAWQAYYSGR